MWFLFRHGETFKNKYNISQGVSDNSFLTFKGIIESHMNGMRLKSLYKDINWQEYKFVCSPLSRAYHSCKLIMESLNIDDNPEIENLLINRSKGYFENKEKSSLKEIYKKEFDIIKENPWGFNIENFDNYKISFIRLAKFIEKYKNINKLIIVAHKGVNRNLLYLLSKNEKNIVNYVNNISDEEGNKLIKELKLIKGFTHNDFYCFDNSNIIKY